MRIAVLAAAAVLGAAVCDQAHAARSTGEVTQFCGDRYCSAAPAVERAAPKRVRQLARKAKKGRTVGTGRVVSERIEVASIGEPTAGLLTHPAVRETIGAINSIATRIVDHPPGCPRRAFCGCGVSLYVFGKAVVAGGLAIAKEWLRFPRAEPGPGMVAARRGHVFAILRNLGNGRVLAYDPNSGGHRTRVHVRSLAGYTVVNPRGG